VHQPEGLAAGSCECGECGGKLRALGEDVSEQLEHMPASFKVIRHIRPKLACVRCQRIFQADAPSRSIQRGLPGPGLLAQILVARYCDHTPLYPAWRSKCRSPADKWSMYLSNRSLAPIIPHVKNEEARIVP
jgi:transposase